MDKKQMITEAYTQGQNDEYVSQVLCDNAQEYFNNEVELPEDISDEERDELFHIITEAYIEGYYADYKLEEVIKANLK